MATTSGGKPPKKYTAYIRLAPGKPSSEPTQLPNVNAEVIEEILNNLKAAPRVGRLTGDDFENNFDEDPRDNDAFRYGSGAKAGKYKYPLKDYPEPPSFFRFTLFVHLGSKAALKSVCKTLNGLSIHVGGKRVKLEASKHKNAGKVLEQKGAKVGVEWLNRTNVRPIRDPQAYAGGPFGGVGPDNAWNIQDFERSFRCKIIDYKPRRLNEAEVWEDEFLEFELIGMDPAVANSFRRILIAEVPTFAIDKVEIYQNTSIVQDEVLAHRIGQIPLNIDPRKLDWVCQKPDVNQRNQERHMSPKNTVVFTIKIKCDWNSDDIPRTVQGQPVDIHSVPDHVKYKDHIVTSAHLKYELQDNADCKAVLNGMDQVEYLGHYVRKSGNGPEVLTRAVYERGLDKLPEVRRTGAAATVEGEFGTDRDITLVITKGSEEERSTYGWEAGVEPAPIHDDILIAKLRPGQEIEMLCYATQGIGKTHAKWSPVATAFYRLHPEISFKTPVTGERADQLVKMCPKNVFDIEDIGGVPTAKASRPRDCSMCRECIRDRPGWEKDAEGGPGPASMVELSQIRDRFIFCIESVGQYPVKDLFREALIVLENKIRTATKGLDVYIKKQQSRGGGDRGVS